MKTKTEATVICKPFKVAMVSSNSNSFGLRNMILIAKDGEAWSVCASAMHFREKGTTIHIPLTEWLETQIVSSKYPFELPNKLPRAPVNVVEEAWEISDIK